MFNLLLLKYNSKIINENLDENGLKLKKLQKEIKIEKIHRETGHLFDQK